MTTLIDGQLDLLEYLQEEQTKTQRQRFLIPTRWVFTYPQYSVEYIKAECKKELQDASTTHHIACEELWLYYGQAGHEDAEKKANLVSDMTARRYVDAVDRLQAIENLGNPSMLHCHAVAREYMGLAEVHEQLLKERNQ
ncbi:hypothetical protein ACIP5Z_01540 [Rothia terrae]|uniref:hypothetical protein n=1 Tax=Rothia terrae TaxID=396015 RepID=UPI0037F66FE3